MKIKFFVILFISTINASDTRDNPDHSELSITPICHKSRSSSVTSVRTTQSQSSFESEPNWDIVLEHATLKSICLRPIDASLNKAIQTHIKSLSDKEFQSFTSKLLKTESRDRHRIFEDSFRKRRQIASRVDLKYLYKNSSTYVPLLIDLGHQEPDINLLEKLKRYEQKLEREKREKIEREKREKLEREKREKLEREKLEAEIKLLQNIGISSSTTLTDSLVIKAINNLIRKRNDKCFINTREAFVKLLKQHEKKSSHRQGHYHTLVQDLIKGSFTQPYKDALAGIAVLLPN